MSTRFVSVDRGQPLLLPPDLRDWVPEDDLVHFVIEAVESLPEREFHVNARGPGCGRYPPPMMLTLPIYCYAIGVFSSRRIGRTTHREFAVRYMTADAHADHDTIATFRRENFGLVSKCFVHVLELAWELKLLKVGTVSVDGTKPKASANMNRNVRYDRTGELVAQLDQEVRELFDKAERTGQEEEVDGQRLPGELAGSAKGCEIKKPSETPRAEEHENLRDTDSRLMRKNKRSGYKQAYDAQAVVDAGGSQPVLSARVSQCASDRNELSRSVDAIPASLGRPTTVLATPQAWLNEAQVRALEGDGEAPAMEVLVSVHAEAKQLRRKHDLRPLPADAKEPPQIRSAFVLEMKEKMSRGQARQKYRLRKQTVEPVFGIVEK